MNPTTLSPAPDELLPAPPGPDGRERAAKPGPQAGDVQPCENETRDRIITGLVTVLPVIGLLVAGVQLWNEALHWRDLFILAALYIPTVLGITVGFHRLLTHRSFETSPRLRGLFAILGSAAVEGPVISWVADHRKHHAFADRVGDPHSPHVDHGSGWTGALRGLFHAHVGWIFVHTDRGARDRFAPDLVADPVISWVDRNFLVWAIAGFLIPFGLGFAIGGTVVAGLTGMLWGGLVRIFILHHVTYSINSLCHFFGSRSYDTDDHSRNLAWLAPLSFGEAWHNNHHAFPTSAEHGLRRREFDPSALLINGLERLGLAHNVVRISPERQHSRAVEPAGASGSDAA